MDSQKRATQGPRDGLSAQYFIASRQDLSHFQGHRGAEADALLADKQAKGDAIDQHLLLGANPFLETLTE